MTDSKPNIYNHSKLYKLQCEDGHYYIGSTTQALSVRLGGHKVDSKRHSDRDMYSHINDIGWDKVKIVLISEHNLENREQLLREEDKLIKECKNDLLCLNTKRAIISKKEYYEENKEYKKNQSRLYHHNNREIILEKQKKYYEDNKEELSNKMKIYREENKEILKYKRKEYYENNKDKILEKHAEKIECICGSTYAYNHKARHERTQKHLNYINSHVASSSSSIIEQSEPNDIIKIQDDGVQCSV